MLSLTWSSECDQQVEPIRHKTPSSRFNNTKESRFNSEPTSKFDQGQQARTTTNGRVKSCICIVGTWDICNFNSAKASWAETFYVNFWLCNKLVRGAAKVA